MPRKTRTRRLLLRSLGCFEERRERTQVLVAERVELRHRRARAHARGILEMPDLEVDPLVLRAFARQVRRAEVRRAGAQVRMAVRAARLREKVGAGDRRRVAGESLLLRPGRNLDDNLRGKRLLGRSPLVL